VGAAVDVHALNSEPLYAQTLAAEFNYVTPENAMKWEVVEPQQGQWDFSDGDALVAFAKSHGMRVKGHNLVWHQQLPAWVSALAPADLRAALIAHVRTEAAHFRGQVIAWDVVNEAVADDGTNLRTTPFLAALGPDYIALAFQTAHDADPDALLIYNDYGGEDLGPKSNRVFQLMNDLLAVGVPVHGIGLQMHVGIISNPAPADVAANIARLTALGLQVNISEMDVMVGVGRVLNESDQQRAYHDLVSACASHPGCGAVTFWGFTDAHSWINSLFGAGFEPLLFDQQYSRKPAWHGVEDALRR